MAPIKPEEKEEVKDELWGALFIDALHTQAMKEADGSKDFPAPPPLGPGAEVLMLQLGLFEAQAGTPDSLEQAGEWFARALARNPDREETLFYVAKLEIEVKGNQEAALPLLKKCMLLYAHSQECSAMLESIGPEGEKVIREAHQAASAAKAKQLGTEGDAEDDAKELSKNTASDGRPIIVDEATKLPQNDNVIFVDHVNDEL